MAVLARSLAFPLLTLCLAAPACFAQTTQGLIAGRVYDSLTGLPLGGACIRYLSSSTDTSGAVASDGSGSYVLPPLSPGLYRIRVARDGYQAREVYETDLPVAGRIELDFRLRPLSEVWETSQDRSAVLPETEFVVDFYGPDVALRSGSLVRTTGNRGVLETTLSQVIDPDQVRHLPFFGRDLYTMLVIQPGVSADAGTARGLGLTSNGQRPSASNYLLDGLEANHYLLSGPLLSVAPEAMQEYRVSTSSYSAEYGRTSGFLANAVTRAGGNRWHGVGYLNVQNDMLNANGFQANRLGHARAPLKETQLGYWVGTPVRKNRVFLASALERLRSRGRQAPITVNLPTTFFLSQTAPDSLARTLVERFPPPAVADGRKLVAPFTVEPPVSADRSLAIQRLDYVSRNGFHRLMGRVAAARLTRPDFIWSPYKDFVSGLRQPAESVAFGAVSTVRANLANEFRLGWSRDELGWDRAHPEIPTLIDTSSEGTLLPGSLGFYGFRNRNRSWEALDHLMWVRGRHIFKFGGNVLLRRWDGFLTAGRDGRYLFPTVVDFLVDLPSRFSVSVSRRDLPQLVLPRFDRRYRHRQFAFFAQDTLRLSPRWTINLGLRWDRFGAPVNTGDETDGAVVLGEGADFAGRLQTARLAFDQGGSLYRASNRDWALRFGFSRSLTGDGSTLARGAYGIFHDRPFDNLWQSARNNSFSVATFDYQPSPGGYLAPVRGVLPLYENRFFSSGFPSATLFQQDWKTAYAQTYFFGLQRRWSGSWLTEVSAQGALGRALVTTDLVNRPFSLLASQAGAANPGRYLNPDLPEIAYRGSQGLSSYHALAAMVRYHNPAVMFQLAYTGSHSIDHQSEPLAGDFFDLSFARLAPRADAGARAAFSRQFDSSADRGNSDFDQRHNLVFFSTWELPAPRSGGWLSRLLRDWRFSHLAAFRSGFPYTVFAPSTPPEQGGSIANNRADLADPARVRPQAPAVAPGGKRLLSAEAFREPPAGRLGNLGRNAFRGPGLFNTDISLSRSISWLRLGEAGRVVLRADAFNFLNHANLNTPDSVLASPAFGVALYGRRGRDTGFPALTPFQETARQIQLILRIEF